MSRIRKIKYNPNKNEFLILQEEGKLFGEGKIEYSCKKKPHEDFINSLQDFKEFVNDFCQLGMQEKSLKENLTITGICIDYQENKEDGEFMGFILITQRKLGDKILNITTPRCTTETKDCPGIVTLIDKILEEALAYMNGKEADTSQLNLFEGSLEEATKNLAQSMKDLNSKGCEVSIKYIDEPNPELTVNI